MRELSHLRLLNPRLESATGGMGDIIPFLSGKYKITTDTGKIALAIVALVDDYAHFCADNASLRNPSTPFFDELRRRMRFAGFEYYTFCGGGDRVKSLEGLQELMEKGYSLKGELPRDDGKLNIGMIELMVGFKVSFRHDNGELIVEDKIVGDKIVRSQWWFDHHEFFTECATTYFGDGFSLERIHSSYYKPRKPVIDV